MTVFSALWTPDDAAKEGFMKEFINAIMDTLIAKIAEE